MTVRCVCGWEDDVSLLDRVCTFIGNQEEPAEYADRCPDCGILLESSTATPLCSVCKDVDVDEPGMICTVCDIDRVALEVV